MTFEGRLRRPSDALSLLEAEHRALCASLDTLRAGGPRTRTASRKLAGLCRTLRHHSQIELELFYPLFRSIPGLDDWLDAARIEHRTINELIVELLNASPRDGLRAARIEALAMYVVHHFQEEEEKLFPRIRESRIDLAALEMRIRARRKELESEERQPECRANAA
jgi:Hemerythrin HHE cation binding domain